MWAPVLILVVLGASVLVLRGRLGGAKFIIKVRGPGAAGVQIRGAVPGHGHSDIAAFVADLELPAGSKISGFPEGPRIQLRFSREVPTRLHQRLRNFLYLQV